MKKGTKNQCKGSCEELIPKEIAEKGGKYTESGRTVIHHPKAMCHYISNLPCPNCHSQDSKLFINESKTEYIPPTEKDPVGKKDEEKQFYYNRGVLDTRAEIRRKIEELRKEKFENIELFDTYRETYEEALDKILEIIK